MNKNPHSKPKNVDLVSQIATQLNTMADGERTRITPFAHSIKLSNERHPHVETVKNKLMEAFLWQDITSKVKFIVKNNQIFEIEKINPRESQSDNFIRKELREDLLLIKNKLEDICHQQDLKLQKKR